MRPIQDHPHACGDKSVKLALPETNIGSSPRVWGQVVLVISDLPFTRIIPTRVGTSRPSVRKSGYRQDHPHACGDKIFLFGQKLHGLGSSPRVWGQENRMWLNVGKLRIIPTRVGTRSFFVVCSQSTQDHPHACGDKCLLTPNNRPCLGSSPRVWGQVAAQIDRQTCDRIIPTRVGTRNDKRTENKEHRDHPHACGDKYVMR